MKRDIVIIGSGGHACSLIDLIESTNKFKIIGITCNKKRIGNNYLGYKILGNDSYLNNFKKKPFIALGFSLYKNLDLYEKKFLTFKKLGYSFPKIISPFAYVSKRVKLGEGTNIFHGAIINRNCVIGQGVTVNSKTLIEHDTMIDSFSHISTGCILNGGIKIDKKIFIGSGTVVKENIKIVKKKFIKMGSLVVRNI